MSDLNRRNFVFHGTGMAATLGVSAGAGGMGAEFPHSGKPISAADFGARGDGRADDTDALQAALDRTFVGGAPTVLTIAPGRYKITRTLRIATKPHPAGNITARNGIMAQGARLESMIRDGSPVLEFESRAVTRFTTIEGLQIQGNGREGDGLLIHAQHRGTYFYNFCLRDIVVQGCGGDGLHMVGNVFEGQLVNCYSRDNKKNGATFSHGPENTVLSAVHVFGSVFGGNGLEGAALVNGAADVSFHGCYFLLNGQYGLSADVGCTYLANCGFENNHQSASSFEKGGAGIRLMVFGTLIGCTGYSIHNQTHLVRAFITNRLVMIGCSASGAQSAKGAKLAELAGNATAQHILIGCSGGIDHRNDVHLLELGPETGGLRLGSSWNSRNLAQLGKYHLWVDAAGHLRIKNGPPRSDEDGSQVGVA